MTTMTVKPDAAEETRPAEGVNRTNEEELELFADLIEPAAEILADGKVRDTLRDGGTLATAVKWAIKGHKGAVIEILARLEGRDPAGYRVRAAELPEKLLALAALPGVRDLFPSQSRRNTAGSSGSAWDAAGAPPA